MTPQRSRILILIAIAFAAMTFGAGAQTPTHLSTEKSVDVSSTKSVGATLTESTQQPWLLWELTRSDWLEYEKIMSGPRGTWSPDISPVSALGIHAKTDVERMKYAEIAARQDWNRLMAERAWYMTYNTAKERVFAPKLKALLDEQPTLMQLRSHDRLVFFTDDHCNPVCRRVLTHVLDIGASLDIYFVGTSDRAVITQWAKANNISPEKVNTTKQVTLNVDAGFFQRVAIDTSLPQLFRRDKEQQQLTEVRL